MDNFKIVTTIIAILVAVAQAVIALVAVILVLRQLRQQTEQHRQENRQQLTALEDDLVDQYRNIVKDLPASAFLPVPSDKEEAPGWFDGLKDNFQNAFYRYFDFANQEISLRNEGRISPETWKFWKDGMKSMFDLPQFKRAWESISQRTQRNEDNIEICFFRELRWLKDKSFTDDADPIAEKQFHCQKYKDCPVSHQSS